MLEVKVVPIIVPHNGELVERFNNRVVEVIKEIVADNFRRMQPDIDSKDALNGGCFYGNEYYRILKNRGEVDRLNWFLNKGSFFHGYASPKHFTMLNDREKVTKITPNFFLIKKGVTPCEALDAIRKGISFIGCGEACQIAYYEGIKTLFGEEKFNALFSANSKSPFAIGLDSLRNPLNVLFTHTENPDVINKGEMAFYSNTPSYSLKHINGEAAAYCAMCCDATVGEETFTTLGLAPGGSTASEISQKLLDEYNAAPINNEIVTQEVGLRILNSFPAQALALSKLLADKKFDMESFSQSGGGKLLRKYVPDFQRIAQLEKLSLEKAVELFNSWPQNKPVRRVHNP
jgi:hypothetical protein